MQIQNLYNCVHLRQECCLISIKAAVVQMVITLSTFLSDNDADRCAMIESQFWNWTNRKNSVPIIKRIIHYKFQPDDNIAFINLLKRIANIKIYIDGRTISLNSIRVNITNGKLYPGDPEDTNEFYDAECIFDITSPYDNDGKPNLILSMLAWINFYKRASDRYDSLIPGWLHFDSNSDPRRILSYLAIRFLDRNALNELTDRTAIFLGFGGDSNNYDLISQSHPIAANEYGIKQRIPICGCDFMLLELDIIKLVFPRDGFCETSLSILHCMESNAINFFEIDYQNAIYHWRNAQHRNMPALETSQLTLIEDTNSKTSQIFLTCVITFLSLGAVAYLLLGNFLFNNILPFCGLKNYIFIGAISSIFVLLAATSISRAKNIFSSDGSHANPSYFLRIFKPFVDIDMQEPNRKQIRDMK